MLTNVTADALPTETTTGTFLESLKNKTAKQHRTLESQKLLAALMGTDVTLPEYCDYLLLMQQVEQTFEEKVWPLVQFLFPENFYSKASYLIEQDLAAFKGTSTRLMSRFEIPAIKISTPFALGFSYVMQGSRLGGRVIYKHINKTLGFSENYGARFLADNGANTGRIWRAFLSILSTFVTESKQEEEVIQGAQLAFTSIYDYFETNS